MLTRRELLKSAALVAVTGSVVYGNKVQNDVGLDNIVSVTNMPSFDYGLGGGFKSNSIVGLQGDQQVIDSFLFYWKAANPFVPYEVLPKANFYDIYKNKNLQQKIYFVLYEKHFGDPFATYEWIYPMDFCIDFSQYDYNAADARFAELMGGPNPTYLRFAYPTSYRENDYILYVYKNRYARPFTVCCSQKWIENLSITVLDKSGSSCVGTEDCKSIGDMCEKAFRIKKLGGGLYADSPDAEIVVNRRIPSRWSEVYIPAGHQFSKFIGWRKVNDEWNEFDPQNPNSVRDSYNSRQIDT